MKCHCGKALVEKTVATKTHKAGRHVIVDTSRQALICAEHGVVAWDPIRPGSYPVPYVAPPVIPYRPYGPYVNPFSNPNSQPNTIRPGLTWFGTSASGGNYQA